MCCKSNNIRRTHQFLLEKLDPYLSLHWSECLFVCVYIKDWTFKITFWKKIHIFCTQVLIIIPYITDNMLACNSSSRNPKLGRRVDKWESKDFECADEWSWWLPRTVIKHYVNPNAVNISLVCQVRCSLVCLSAQISFWKKHLDVGLIY